MVIKVEQSLKQDLNISDNIGGNIAKSRAMSNMSQEQLAAKLQTAGCDISRGTIAKIEVGIRHIKISELRTITKVLNTSYDFLIDG